MEGHNNSLPSFPSTTYWYDAHTSVGSSLYPATETLNLPFKTQQQQQQQVEAKLTDSEERESLEWWTNDGLCISNEQRTHDAQYWGGHMVKRGYVPSYECSGSETEMEESGAIMVPMNCNPGEPDFMTSKDMMRLDQDDRSMCCDSTSSQTFSPASNTSDTNSSGKKTSPEPFMVPDEQKRSLKRQKKEVKDKAKEDKRCGVCGDAARSMHFGGMACDSCKAFFRRSVQSGAYKTFQCPENENCPISKQNRKVCQYCRFKKSQENGMEISWVMSETDRMVLWKNRLAKQRHIQEEKVKEKMYGDLPRSLDPGEADTLKNLAALQEDTFSSIPYPEDCFGDSVEALANLFVCICKKLGMFFNKVEDFQTVSRLDQSLLLKNGIGMSIYLHGVYMYDPDKQMWPAESNREAFKIPPISMGTLRKFSVLPEAFNAIMKFYNKYAREMKDEIILALICVVAFFQPDDPQFQNSKQIQDIQLKYLELLRHYLLAKEGEAGVKVTFPKLLVGLADVKEILEFHSKVDIKPTINHQQVATQTSVKYPLSAVNDLFQKACQGLLPEFSSVLSSAEKKQPLWQQSMSKTVGRRKRPSASTPIVRGDQFYHPITNHVFGRDPRTDMIITNPWEQLRKGVQMQKFQTAQISEVGLNREYKKNSKDWKKELERTDSTSNVPAIYHSNNTQLQSTSSSNYHTKHLSHFDPSDRKRAMEVLCNVLQHVSCQDSDHVLRSLKQNLSPHLLTDLAHKLSS
ncbi:hypothetical protein Pcinc_025593 [Petrolisthes cinctipes]|uniref:Uncharacterized protein n=1 Tax=Petrolisthes cinctipes TaxID=88211 RepID=A0AAE1KDJ5_PETCI|nr:hypothetical protein Pcinc_025593 [Petrolisthes cinctipes]